MLLNSIQASVRVAQTKSNSEQESIENSSWLPFKQWFFREKKFYREHLLILPQTEIFTAVKKKFLLRTACVLELEGSVKKF